MTKNLQKTLYCWIEINQKQAIPEPATLLALRVYIYTHET
jgi:hypothetical protein